MFSKILVPVDISEPEIAQPALKQATLLAKAGGAQVRLIYIRSVVPVSFMEFMPPNFDGEQQDEAEAAVKALADKMDLPASTVSSTVRLGGVYPEVLAEAKDWGADLVVVGSHRPAMSTYLLGSNATAIVRHALCSVLVVRE